MSGTPAERGAEALILCHGEPPSPDLLGRHVAEADLIICTDGAAQWAHDAGVAFDVVIGDMDSLTGDTFGACPTRPSTPAGSPGRLFGALVIESGEHEGQENTDAEKAVLYALERGARRIVLLGATGRRLDHTLGNVWLSYRYADRAEVVLADDWCELRAVRRRLAMRVAPGTTVSIVPLSAEVFVTTGGLEWPLDEVLEAGTRGLSNRAVGEEITIDVSGGAVAVLTLSRRD